MLRQGGVRTPGQGEISSPPPEIGYIAPSAIGEGSLSARGTDLKDRIMAKLETWIPRSRLPRLREVPSEGLLDDVNGALRTIPTTTITDTNKLIYTTAAVISEMLGYKLNSHKGQYPPWRRRLEGKIKVARREVSQLTELQKGATKKVHKKYSKLSIPEALETAKQRLTALASRLRRYTREIEGRRINQLFSTEPAKVYSQWQGNNKRTAPPRLETEQYWKSIWENDATHNGNAQWLVDLRADHSDLPEQGPVTITVADIQERVSSMKSWTAPGPDMVHAYWLKKLTALHERLAAQMNQLLVNERHPEWLTEGRTVLIPKDPKKGPVPSNYRPITCLSTTWKLLSGIISAKMNRHMGQYMSGAQKGIGKNTRGAKHQLLVDRTVSRDCKTRLTNLCTAWIDYKKAYDSMPHSWILECLELYKINRTLRAFIRNSMGMWRTTLEANSKSIAQVTIKCGIYQGDALSPLLFCIGLNPLSEIINKTGYGYRLRNGAVVSHLLYMDDIKLYAKSERDIDSLIHTTRLYSNDIGMSFGLEKCSRMVTKRGKVVRTEGIELPEGNIADIEDSYKYLGIPQANGNHEEAARKAATTKYLQRVRQVLRSQLNGKNKIRAINTYALPVIRYPAGVIGWPKEEIEATDIKTRKLLTMHGGFHPKSSTLRLYAKRKEGGRGLVSVSTTVQDETRNIHEYITKMAPTDSVLSEYLRQQKPKKEEEGEEPSWKDRPLHGMYHRQIEEVADIQKSYQWLDKAGLKDSTEALIMAAQEQALSTRSIEAGVYHTRQDPRCRLCKDAPETIQHITAGCKMLAGKAYMERHNQVAGIVYRNICAEYNLEVPRSKWETPPRVMENDRAKILWDFQMQTDKMVVANQPDIVVVDKQKKTAVVIDVAVPNDSNIRKKEHEKLEKYQGLREELERMWRIKVTVVPVVIGALGAVTPKLGEWLQQIPGTTSEISVQKSAVLGTAKILRRTLKLPGLW
uniref:Reverse transcriptase domain-containing protein n=1 Tax=Oreochromis niloticus TaxID=8128 RepID=A0A669EZW7_ORENI